MSTHPIVRLEDVRKSYRMGDLEVDALKCINLDIEEGGYVAVMGPSGCGKSTMLNLLGCLDRPTSGRYLLGGDNVSDHDDDTLSAIRGRHIGFVFQSYNLIQQLSVLENIEVPLFYQGAPEEERRTIALELAALVGLESRTHHRPYELSGGQQQRVGIARALAANPLVLLADEPTGNLDTASGTEILELFDALHDQGKTLIVVTHEDEVGKRARRVVRLRDGQVESDIYN
ncbi:MAG: ABC transporter ATP-binding protein [Candidatus Hydrogenedentes bacterium]|nr:ABC transporter ATP-binding protein [Candidatus Hydrogenedentota bacterium]